MGITSSIVSLLLLLLLLLLLTTLKMLFPCNILAYSYASIQTQK